MVKASLAINETQQQSSTSVYNDITVTRNKIVTAQFECYQKLMKENTHSRQGKAVLIEIG